MKGITPIISIIILLLIAVSISAAAWTYISGYWSGLIGSAIEITSSICSSDGTTAVVYIHNIGTNRLNILNGLEIDRTDGGTAVLEYDPADGIVEAGNTGKVKDTNCTQIGIQNRCMYDIVHGPSGRLYQTYMTCPG